MTTRRGFFGALFGLPVAAVLSRCSPPTPAPAAVPLTDACLTVMGPIRCVFSPGKIVQLDEDGVFHPVDLARKLGDNMRSTLDRVSYETISHA